MTPEEFTDKWVLNQPGYLTDLNSLLATVREDAKNDGVRVAAKILETWGHKGLADNIRKFSPKLEPTRTLGDVLVDIDSFHMSCKFSSEVRRLADIARTAVEGIMAMQDAVGESQTCRLIRATRDKLTEIK